MVRYMYDSVSPSAIPHTATLVAGYVDGKYKNMEQMHTRFPHAVMVGIATSHRTNAGVVLDVEQGDASPDGALAWVKMRREAGVQDVTVYCNQSTWSPVKAVFAHAKVRGPYYWIANWNGSTVIPDGAIAHQFKGAGSYDISSVAKVWPGVDTNGTVRVNPPYGSKHVYRVQAGDTLSEIAEDNHVTLKTLEVANLQIKNPNLIYPGELVFIPSSSVHVTEVKVVAGDTMTSIAAKHGLSLRRLETLNPQIKNPNLIYPGQEIRVA